MDPEHRFIFFERLFDHMAVFRAAGYRYYFKPRHLRYRPAGGKPVFPFALDEVVLEVGSTWRNPKALDLTKKVTEKGASWILTLQAEFPSAKIKSPRGTPFPMYFKGTEVHPGKKLGVDGTPTGEAVTSINCCTATLAALFVEWRRVMQVGYPDDDPAAKARRLTKKLYQYFMVGDATLPAYAGAATTACDREAGLLVRDGGQSWIDDLRNLRRGDIAQVWWDGVKVSEEGHSVFVHDVRWHKGQLYFQLLSAQDHNSDRKGTCGVGVAGSGLAEYASDDGVLQARLSDAAKWYRYKHNDRSEKHLIIPDMYAGRFRRPFPCWPLALGDAPQGKLPLPEAFTGPGYASSLHSDDFFTAPAAAYHDAAETADGGYYPLGLSRAWHGGVHLPAQPGTPVRAIADGVLVAARCAPNQGDGPSRNFVLVRHQVAVGGATQVFYSLLMHLRGEAAGSRPFAARWLWQMDRQPKIKGYTDRDGRALAEGRVVCLAYPVAAGEVLGHTDGADCHVEVFSETDLTDGSYADKALVEDLDGNGLYDSERLLALLNGAVELGEHLQVWTPSTGAARSGVVLQQELQAFMVHGDERVRETLRGLVTRHISEWSTAVQWPALKDTASWGYYDTAAAQALQDAQRQGAWMDADVAHWARLPASGLLFHYHPIQFIDWLAGQTTQGAILPLVQQVSDIVGQGPAPQADAPQELEEAPPPPAADAEAQEGSAPRWERVPGAGRDTLAVGSLGGDGRFQRQRREGGPWNQIGEPRRSPNGLNTFVQVDGPAQGAGALWLCVRSGETHYARLVH